MSGRRRVFFQGAGIDSRGKDRPLWVGMEAARKILMRHIKLSGREATVVRAIGFTEAMMGAEIHDSTKMEADIVTDTLNSLMSAGYVESVPYYDEVQIAEMPVTAFELNPAYVQGLKQALYRR
jgi:hypothetical protein